jgi:hypothetical protein
MNSMAIVVQYFIMLLDICIKELKINKKYPVEVVCWSFPVPKDFATRQLLIYQDAILRFCLVFQKQQIVPMSLRCSCSDLSCWVDVYGWWWSCDGRWSTRRQAHRSVCRMMRHKANYLTTHSILSRVFSTSVWVSQSWSVECLIRSTTPRQIYLQLFIFYLPPFIHTTETKKNRATKAKSCRVNYPRESQEMSSTRSCDSKDLSSLLSLIFYCFEEYFLIYSLH